ncbi:MAG: GNAT family N-acetyltransferase [Cyanobacteria bacterium P01_D01_bin.6]
MQIRLATRADVPALAKLFHETVMKYGPTYYSEAQTCAWAAAALDLEQFELFILGGRTWVAEMTTDLVGFSGLAEDGRVASLYVHHAYLKQGIGSALLAHVMEQAHRDRLPRLYTEASEFSRGLFQKFGFQQYDTEVVQRLGVSFTRYRMERCDVD